MKDFVVYDYFVVIEGLVDEFVVYLCVFVVCVREFVVLGGDGMGVMLEG